MIWGLVLQKARNGMSVSTSKDTSSVGETVKKTGTLIALILGATVLQFVANYQTPVQTAAPASHPVLQQAHRLQAASPMAEELPASFYDKSSSHYMGGAHNAALMSVRDGTTKKTKSVQVPTQATMGGAHNAALNAMAIKSAKKAQVTQKSSMTFLPTLGSIRQSYQTHTERPLTQAELQDNIKATSAIMGLFATIAMCMYFFINMKCYHASLEKLDALTALLNNPNARVANAEQGKQVMKKLRATREPQAQPQYTENADLEKANQIQSTLD
jgi:hypothetical protein